VSIVCKRRREERMNRRESGVGEECCEVKDLKRREKKQGEEEDESDVFMSLELEEWPFLMTKRQCS